MSRLVTVDPQSPDRAAVRRAADLLRAGGLVAFPTETVYGLGAHALDPAAVRKIFIAKDRPDWDPLIVHIGTMEMARSLAKDLPPRFEELARRFWPGPLTMIVKKAAGVPDEVTARRPTVALRMPRHPLAAALLAAARLPIAAPSANRFGRPSPTRAEHVLADLGERVDLILDGGPTRFGIESSIVDLTQSPPVLLRPGAIPREELEAALGEITTAAAATPLPSAPGLPAPGMSSRHYAPHARLELFEGDPAETARRIRHRATELSTAGRRVGVLVHAEAGLIPEADLGLVYGPWADRELMAARLYQYLRAMDDRGVDVILSIVPPAEGLGLAIRDRLQRAAARES